VPTRTCCSRVTGCTELTLAEPWGSRASDRTAIVSGASRLTYRQLDAAASRGAAALVDGRPDLAGARVAFWIHPSSDWTIVALAIWRAGGVAVPLAAASPPPEIEFVIRDADASIVVGGPASPDWLAPLAASAGARFVTTDALQALPGDAIGAPVAPDRPALILYTSGTTGRPKGVVTTHANVAAQTRSLVAAWGWTPDDRALLVLPLHHVHGIINVVTSALAAGAACEMLPRFDARPTWDRLASGDLSVFTAVPTIYHRLIAAWDAAPDIERRAWSDGARGLRLMMSGSAALPVGVLSRWREITGHTLLERYGMTEIGMGLSNPLAGSRRPGFVGAPLPGVAVRLVDETGTEVPAGTVGEVEVRGPGVFTEYWRRPDETRAAFRNGWFRTGDVAVVEHGVYRLLGRTSVDIIKTGGHKVSALEIEEVVRQHPAVSECAVIGVKDDEWGERVAVVVELRAGGDLELAELQAWARTRFAPHKVPRDLRCVAALPRNAMGKIVKPDLVPLFDARAGGERP
jgi:malonyl-CoA/methylmalonyl-CoA synthetase